MMVVVVFLIVVVGSRRFTPAVMDEKRACGNSCQSIVVVFASKKGSRCQSIKTIIQDGPYYRTRHVRCPRTHMYVVCTKNCCLFFSALLVWDTHYCGVIKFGPTTITELCCHGTNFHSCDDRDKGFRRTDRPTKTNFFSHTSRSNASVYISRIARQVSVMSTNECLR